VALLINKLIVYFCMDKLIYIYIYIYVEREGYQNCILVLQTKVLIVYLLVEEERKAMVKFEKFLGTKVCECYHVNRYIKNTLYPKKKGV
jgi:hypothetical protein